MPRCDGVGLTWASLRAGGATHRYQCGMPMPELQWAGRWKSATTLEHYVQEWGAASFLQTMPYRHRLAAQLLAQHSWTLLLEAINNGLPAV